MKKYFLSFVLFALSLLTLAQETITTVDSLLYDSKFDLALTQLDLLLKKKINQEQHVILENKKAEILIRAGKFDDAERVLESIILKPSTSNTQVITETNRGFLFLNQGRNDLALTTLQQALINIENQNKQNSLEGAQLLSYLGNLYLATGKYSQAEEQFSMALTIRRNFVKENSELIAASYNDLGLVYSTTDADKALDYYEKALIIYERIHGKNNPKIAIANTNMGFVYRTLEFYGDAINNFESALVIWEKIYPEPHPTKAFILFNLGQTYLKMRNENSAEGYYNRALNMYQDSYGKKHPEIATVLNAIGSLKLSGGKFNEALEHFQQALIANVSDFSNSSLKSNPKLKTYYSGNILLFSLLHKAEALEARHFNKSLKFNELSLALNTLQLCDSLIDNLRQQINNESDKILLGTIATDVYGAGVRIAYEAGQVAAKKKTWFELAFFFAEKSKSAVLLEAISDSNAKSFSGIPNDLLEQEKKLKAEIALTAQKLSLKPSESEEKYLRQVHFNLNRNYQNFIKELEEKFPVYYNLRFNVATPAIKSLQEKLDTQTAIVSYFTDDKNNRLYVFQITTSKFRVDSHQLTKEFDRNLSGLRNSLVFNDLLTYKTAAIDLSELLIPKKIPLKVKELVVLPTGRLSIVPFETLFHKKIRAESQWEDFPYLIQRYSVRYEFSAALILQKSKTERPGTTSIFLCAPVTFQKDGLAELPGTEAEVKEISQLFTSKNLASELVIGKDAAETRVKQGALKDFSYVHFATHGVVDETNPELSRIYLNATANAEDGNLYASEIYNMELKADLVTLSACQTGLGKISKGEGVIGLSRALVYAGSKNIVVSFWSVADQSTASLMKIFYRHLLNNTQGNFGKALQEAKLALLHEKKYAAPYYWGPFILIGF
ncbi:CHAT domain-containing tetratricopeptide repeat protein [Chryseolinea sp. H1M3-3]|uniref:CHAT domain-containing protein n=1 Tax=Chryseolinea sp. H1M3-3 TaxID=3034144 RepID=UPI0023ECE997|nr:CHAT domain-containing tetratricopeptide repeat protein [Chryseolinea sp. H1M3-3]